ncbi:aminoacyl-tRNA hydrolase [Marinicrinis lubricantis]|uniref:Peptidyl-tRNA hydrolase n=1 Tax=Marinicrinis lubricantis TaxID=2086470 RepID=A0ABW1IQF7_9BACL
MKWFVGLGNPGKQYEDTRHNVGFMALDQFAEQWGLSFNKKQCRADIAEGHIDGQKVVLIKPMTYMNLSGESVRAFLDYYKADLEEMVVLYDDLDTEVGKIRLRYQGSAGGHNGIKSIIQHVSTQQFNRIRIGISRPEKGWNIADYVLSSFPKSEREPLQAAIDHTCAAMRAMLDDPFEKVMGKYNG